MQSATKLPAPVLALPLVFVALAAKTVAMTVKTGTAPDLTNGVFTGGSLEGG